MKTVFTVIYIYIFYKIYHICGFRELVIDFLNLFCPLYSLFIHHDVLPSTRLWVKCSQPGNSLFFLGVTSVGFLLLSRMCHRHSLSFFSLAP